MLGFTGGNPSSAAVELPFVQETSATARVDVRFGFSAAISRWRFEKDLWGVVQSCTMKPTDPCYCARSRMNVSRTQLAEGV